MSSEPGSVERYPPLKPVVFLILLVLAERPLHGYAVMREVERRSEGKIRLATGPLYRQIRKLLEAGLLEEIETEDDSGEAGRRRCDYRLSELGEAVVKAERERLARLLETTQDLFHWSPATR